MISMGELASTVNEMMAAKTQGVIVDKIKVLLNALKLPENVKDFQNLALHDLRDLTVQESQIIGELLKVKTIKDLSKVPYEQILNNISLLRNAGIPKNKLELLITAAKFIVKAADYKPLEGKKVVIAGLDNAGKTALLKTIKKEVGFSFSELSGLKPTKGANRDELYLEDQELHILELGGQEEFRKFYIENPDRFFIDTDIILYIVDMQDDVRYQDAIEYLQSILRTVQFLQEAPDFIILLHKCDPDLMKAPMFQDKVDYMYEQITNSFKGYPFKFEIQTSSILNIISMTPSFSTMLKGIFTGGPLEEERKLESMGDLLTKVVDLFLKMEENVNRDINFINQQLNILSNQISDLGKVGTAVTSTGTASKPGAAPQPSAPKPAGPGAVLSPRSQLLNELKEVIGIRGKRD